MKLLSFDKNNHEHVLLKRGIQYPTVKCYREGEFSTKRFDKFKECQTNESTKKDSFTKKKKRKHRTEGKKLKC